MSSWRHAHSANTLLKSFICKPFWFSMIAHLLFISKHNVWSRLMWMFLWLQVFGHDQNVIQTSWWSRKLLCVYFFSGGLTGIDMHRTRQITSLSAPSDWWQDPPGSTMSTVFLISQVTEDLCQFAKQIHYFVSIYIYLILINFLASFPVECTRLLEVHWSKTFISFMLEQLCLHSWQDVRHVDDLSILMGFTLLWY